MSTAPMPVERVLGSDRANRCEVCGHRLQPSRPWQSHCSPACRKDHWKARQHALDFDPKPAPVPSVVDQRVSVADRVRLTGHNARMLELLREGPAPNTWLAQQFPPATAWRSRISDVRLWLQARGETVAREDCGGGLNWYWIESAA